VPFPAQADKIVEEVTGLGLYSLLARRRVLDREGGDVGDRIWAT
jgi:hypothetical protein